MSTHSKPQNEEVKYQLCEHQDCLKFWTPTIGYWSECRYPETVKLPGLFAYLLIMSTRFVFVYFSNSFLQVC